MRDLHQFWFEQIELTLSYYERQIPRWFFRNSPDFDKDCEEFIHTKTSDPLLKILIYDQLPRNLYRGSHKAYARDLEAQEISLTCLDTAYERSLSLPERIFLYMPLQHAENLELQSLSVKKFMDLHAEAPEAIKTWTKLGVDKAVEHWETIRREGHFPQRLRVQKRELDETVTFHNVD